MEEFANSIAGCECFAIFPSADETIRLIPRLKPDLVLMDIHLPNLSGFECAAKLKRSLSELAILMLTVYEAEETIFEVFKTGVNGYILKRRSPREAVEKAACPRSHPVGAQVHAHAESQSLSAT